MTANIESNTTAGIAPDLADAYDWPSTPDLPGPPKAESLPVHVLPTALRKHVQSVADSMQVPTDMSCLVALGTISAAIAGCVEISIRNGWSEPSGTYAACILPPASRKSPCYAVMTAPVHAWETEAIQNAGPKLEEARDLVAVCEQALEDAIRALAKGKGSKEELIEVRRALTEARSAMPPDGRLLAGDITPEEMTRRMHAQEGRLAIMEPEPGPLQLLSGRYSNAGTARLDELKKCWSAEPILIDRVNRASVRIDRPALTLMLMLQPGVLESLPNKSAFRHEGVLGRFLWCQPPHGLGRRLTGPDVPPLDEEAKREYDGAIRVLLDFKPATADDGKKTPHVMSLSCRAIETLHSFEAETEAELVDGGKYAPIRDWAGKMVGQSVRVAAQLALFERAATGAELLQPLDGKSMADGVSLLRAFGTHALQVLATPCDERSADLDYLLQRLRSLDAEETRSGLVSESRLRQATRGRASIKAREDKVTDLINELEARGCLRRLYHRTAEPGRPPSATLQLHPELASAETTV